MFVYETNIKSTITEDKNGYSREKFRLGLKSKLYPPKDTKVYIVDEEFMNSIIFLNKKLFERYTSNNDFKFWWDTEISNEEWEQLKKFDSLLDKNVKESEGIGDVV